MGTGMPPVPRAGHGMKEWTHKTVIAVWQLRSFCVRTQKEGRHSMTDTENVFDSFTLLDDDEELDMNQIFGSGSDEPAPPPPAPTLAEEVKSQPEPEQVQTETAESQPEPEQTLPAKTQEAPAKEKQPLELFSAFTSAESDPIPEAAPVKSIAPRPQTQLSLFDKPPVFQYGGAREQITDADMTFESLRIQKADDFPELEDASAVTWQVRYGDITKAVPTPKTDTIAAMKAEIEKSKAFLDSLKKGKVKDPECVVKPQIRMQKKGIADYKGVFPTLEAARASNKVICLIPSRDGQTYEMRRSELGEFIAPKHKITEFSEVRAGFRPALPRIPQELLRSIIGFFRSQMESGAEFEALVRIYWDRKEQKFIPFVPKQRATKDSVTVRLTDEDLPDDTQYLYYADIHSHNSMKAIFSAIDDQDERGTRLYLVIGHLERFFPEISARISCGGSFVPIEPSLVLEGLDGSFPTEWSGKVVHQLPELPEAPSAHFAGVRSLLGGLLGGAG